MRRSHFPVALLAFAATSALACSETEPDAMGSAGQSTEPVDNPEGTTGENKPDPTDDTPDTPGDEPECDTDLSGPAALLACKTDCDPKPAGAPADAVCLKRVVGMLVDDQGAPIPKLGVSVCGEVCYGAASDEAGQFSIPVYDWYVPDEYSVGPHGSPFLSSFYYQLPAEFEGGNDYDAGSLRLLSLPTEGPLLITKADLEDDQIAPEQIVESGGLQLRIGEGTLVEPTIGDVFEGDEGRRFRALEVNSTLREEFAPELMAGSRLFALGPFDAALTPQSDGDTVSVELSVENTLGWVAGSSVDVLALGTYYDDEWVTPHTFGQVGVATVSPDGATVELPADATGLGIRNLTWLALRP